MLRNLGLCKLIEQYMANEKYGNRFVYKGPCSIFIR